MSGAIQQLLDEHAALERAFTAMEATALQLRRGVAVAPQWLHDAASLLLRYVDGLHHAKEEAVLFKALAGYVPPDSLVLWTMLDEHNTGRTLTRQLAIDARDSEAASAGAALEWAENALAYTQLMRAHIQNENRVILPMAEALIPGDELELCSERYRMLRTPSEPLELVVSRLVERALAWWPRDTAKPA